MEQATAQLDNAARDAYDLIRTYADIEDPYNENVTEEENPWQNPDVIFSRLKQARERLMGAWEQVQHTSDRIQQEQDGKQANLDQPVVPTTPQEFRVLYLDMITDAFADVLEDMRENSSGNINVDVLVDCLQSGVDLMNQEELLDGAFFQDLNLDDDDDDVEESMEDDSDIEHDMNKMTPHQLHRIELGFKDMPPISSS